MGSYPAGTLLTCTHNECGCQVRVEVECTCPDAGDPYRCTCGTEMVQAQDAQVEGKGSATRAG
jgi:metallothionein